MPKILIHNGTKCHIKKFRYAHGNRIGLQLVTAKYNDDEPSGLPYATITTNIPDAKLGPNEAIIKNWSENKGILEALEQAGIAKPAHRSITTGYTHAPVVILDETVIAEYLG
jgi:hypothetical protein